MRGSALANLTGLRSRHPQHFATPWRQRAMTAGLLAALVGIAVWAVLRLDIAPGRLLAGLGELVRIGGMMFPPLPHGWPQAWTYAQALVETIAIAFLGTLLGAVLAFPLALLAARNTTIHGVVQFMARRSSDVIRGVDQLIWALIWVTVVGLGPFAGMLAVMTSDIGNLSKLFSEALETADRRPVEGVSASGGSSAMSIRFGVLPQVLPVIAGQCLYFFESNTRSSTIIGIVGAGGIGMHLAEQIRTLEFQSVAFIILLVLGAVVAIDALSGMLRQAIIGTARAQP